MTAHIVCRMAGSPVSGQRFCPDSILARTGVAQRGEGDVALPPGQGAPFEVIEAEFVLQLMILLLDRPALVRSRTKVRSDAVAGEWTR